MKMKMVTMTQKVLQKVVKKVKISTMIMKMVMVMATMLITKKNKPNKIRKQKKALAVT